MQPPSASRPEGSWSASRREGPPLPPPRRRARLPALALLLGLMLIAGAALGLVISVRDVGQTAALVSHTHRLVERADDLLSVMKDAETGQRGFLLTGDRRYLQPYVAARAEVPASLAGLHRLTAGSPEQRARLARMRALVNVKLAELARTVALADAGRREAALAIVATDRGRQTMDRLRVETEAFGAAERRLLAAREAALERGQRLTLRLALAAAVAAVAAVLFAAWLFFRRGRRAEAAAAFNASRLQATHDNAGVGIHELDGDGHYLTVNDSFTRFTGYTAADLAGCTIFDMIADPADRARAQAQFAELKAGTITGYVEERAFTNRFGRHWLALLRTTAVRDDAGRFAYAVRTLEDITEQRQAEAEVRRLNRDLEALVEARTRRLEEVNGELQAFAYSVSHDLRAPLRAMEGFSQALLEDYGDRLDDLGRDYIGRIVGGARQMDALIADLLAYSRLSREEIVITDLPLAAVVASAQRQLGALLAETGARVEVAAPLPSVRGQAAVLTQVIANLVANAVKFVAPGVVPRVRIRAEPWGGCVRLWVEDNGIGIAADHRQRIFEVFQRLHSPAEYPGTGIGLAIVRKGVERLGGSTGVESTPGQGSCFWIDLKPGAEA